MQSPEMGNPIQNEDNNRKKFEITEDYENGNQNSKVYVLKVYLTYTITQTMVRIAAKRTEDFEELKKRDRDTPQEVNSFEMKYKMLSYTLFQSIETLRGKSPFLKFSYNSEHKYLQVRINKHYYLNELKLTEKELFHITFAFQMLWEENYLTMIKSFMELYRINYNCPAPNYKIYLRSIDILAITFEVHYMDKRIYKFRYSPFQFRNVPTFIKDEKNYQLVSCFLESLNNKIERNQQDAEFYNAPRYFFIDDITDSSLFRKIVQRFNIVYQIYNINRGNSIDSDQFNKKVLNYVYFQSTRLKKFSLNFLLKKFPKKELLLRKEIEKRQENQMLYEKEYIVNFAFYLDQFTTQMPSNNKEQTYQAHRSNVGYKIRCHLLDNDKLLSEIIKEQFYSKLKEWQSVIREYIAQIQQNQPNFHGVEFGLERRDKRKEDLMAQRVNKEYFEELEINLEFTNKDKIDKFFTVFQIIASSIFDRYFTSLGEHFIERMDFRRKEEANAPKIVELQTKIIAYQNPKAQYKYYHYFKVHFKNSFLPITTYLCVREEKIRICEWRMDRLFKCMKKVNLLKSQKEPEENKFELKPGDFNEVFFKYINVILKNYNLRVIYKDLMQFIENLCKICYQPLEEANTLHKSQREPVMEKIVEVLHSIMLHYNSQDQKMQKYEKPDKLDKHEKEKNQKEENCNKIILIKIIGKGDFDFVHEEGLHAEVTFKISDFRQIWISKLNFGSIVLRIFSNRVEIEKDFSVAHIIKLEANMNIVANKKSLEEQLQKSLTVCIEQCLLPSFII